MFTVDAASGGKGAGVGEQRGEEALGSIVVCIHLAALDYGHRGGADVLIVVSVTPAQVHVDVPAPEAGLEFAFVARSPVPACADAV